MVNEYLAIYVQDHHAGSKLGIQLLERMLDSDRHEDEGRHAMLSWLRGRLEEDAKALETTMGQLGVKPSRPKDFAAWVSEKMGTLKANGHLLQSSPLSPIVELEGLIAAVNTKKQLWMTLEAWAQHEGDERREHHMRELFDSALEQSEALEQYHQASARELARL